MLEVLDKLKTSPYIIARESMYLWCLLFNKEIEPKHNFRDKFFTILNYEFTKFYEAREDLLILEAPPRTGKTEFDTNIFLCWLLGRQQKNRFLLVVSNRMLKVTLRKKIERVLRSPLFAKVFPDVNVETCNENNISLSNGNDLNFTTTYSMTPIGVGFHWIFLIDFLVSETMSSDAKRYQAYEQLEGILSRTEHAPSTKILVDNQRLGLEDLSAFMTKRYDEMQLQYMRITLPYQFDEDHYYKLGNSGINFHKGEYLVSRFNDHEKKKVIARVGTYRFDTEFMQKARRPEGDLVKREMFRYYKAEELNTIQFTKGFITTDLALKSGKRNDYNVLIFWLVDADDNLYLIDMIRKKMQGYIAEKILYNFYLKWKDGLKNGTAGCNYITIESSNNSELTIQRYKNGFYVDGNKVSLAGMIKELKRIKNKFSRFKQSVAHIELGKMILPSFDVKIDGIDDVKTQIIDPFITEYEHFREDDSHEHDDIVDCGTDAILEASRAILDLSIDY